MKQLKISLVLLIITASFAACKKDKKEEPVTIPIEGKWAGQFLFSGDSSGNVAFDIKNQNNEILLSDGSPNSEQIPGIWSLTGTSFTATFVYNDASNNTTDTYSFTGSFNSADKKITGNLTITIHPNDNSGDEALNGTFDMTKQ